MLQLQFFDVFLRGLVDHALAVQLAVGAAVRLVAGRQQVGRDVAFGGDEGHDLDLVFHVGQLGEEFGLGVAFQQVLHHRVAGRMGGFQAVGVGLIQEDLGFQHLGGLAGDRGIVTQQQVQQHADRRPALHVRQQFERKIGGDFGNHGIAQDDVLEEFRLFASGARRAGQRVVDEELQAVRAVRVICVLDLVNDFLGQCTIVDGLGVQTLFLAGFDFIEIAGVEAHVDSG